MVKNPVSWDMRIEILLKKGARMVIKEARRNIIQSCNIRAARDSGL